MDHQEGTSLPTVRQLLHRQNTHFEASKTLTDAHEQFSRLVMYSVGLNARVISFACRRVNISCTAYGRSNAIPQDGLCQRRTQCVRSLLEMQTNSDMLIYVYDSAYVC
jgi:hypothetical protein